MDSDWFWYNLYSRDNHNYELHSAKHILCTNAKLCWRAGTNIDFLEQVRWTEDRIQSKANLEGINYFNHYNYSICTCDNLRLTSTARPRLISMALSVIFAIDFLSFNNEPC
jgi:hypothetical protein